MRVDQFYQFCAIDPVITVLCCRLTGSDIKRDGFLQNAGQDDRNGDTNATRRAQRGDPELVRKSMSDSRATRLSRLVDELTEAAKRLGFEVRRERILREVGYRARGGACRLHEKHL